MTITITIGTGDIIELRSGTWIRVDAILQTTANGMASVSGTLVDDNGKALPGQGRRGRFCNWLNVAECQMIRRAPGSCTTCGDSLKWQGAPGDSPRIHTDSTERDHGATY